MAHMMYPPPQQPHDVEAEVGRRNERIGKSGREVFANVGEKVIKYQQTDKQRVAHKVFYMVSACLGLAATVEVFASPGTANEGSAGFIFTILALLAGLLRIYGSVLQLEIKDEMTDTMYDLAVKRFQLTNVICTVALVILLVIEIVTVGTNESNTMWNIVDVAFTGFAFALSLAVIIAEKLRVLVKCKE